MTLLPEMLLAAGGMKKMAEATLTLRRSEQVIHNHDCEWDRKEEWPKRLPKHAASDQKLPRERERAPTPVWPSKFRMDLVKYEGRTSCHHSHEEDGRKKPL